MMKKLFIPFLLLTGFSVAFSSHAEVKPRGLAADNRIKTVLYDPNNVIPLISSYGNQTDIVFSPNETIKTVSLGDSSAWMAKPVDNHLFLKPMASSSTNMSVLTDANDYEFHLDSTNPSAQKTYKLLIVYPDGGYDASGRANAIGKFDPSTLNWQYSFTGDRGLSPLEAFDNGQFTYFKFKKGGMAKLPSIFIVDKDRNETLVNYHMEGDFLVVNTVSNQFTFRNGVYVTSIYNDKAIGDWDKI